MQMPGSEPDLPLPDHVPDELLERYGTSARRTVRASRSWRRPLSQAARRTAPLLRDGELWLLALMVFGWSIVGAGALGALIYAAIAFPWAAVYVVLPVAVLAVVSVGVAFGVTRRRGHRELETVG